MTINTININTITETEANRIGFKKWDFHSLLKKLNRQYNKATYDVIAHHLSKTINDIKEVGEIWLIPTRLFNRLPNDIVVFDTEGELITLRDAKLRLPEHYKNKHVPYGIRIKSW